MMSDTSASLQAIADQLATLSKTLRHNTDPESTFARTERGLTRKGCM